MSVPTARQNFDTILENTPISQEDRDRIRDRLDQGIPLTTAEAQLIPNGDYLLQAENEVMREPEPPAPADTTEVEAGTVEVTMPQTPEAGTGDVTLPETTEGGVGETDEVDIPVADTTEVGATQ